jgi:hypothetical protein
MSFKEDSNFAELRANPSILSYPQFTIFLLIALIVFLLGIIFAQSIMMSKLADALNSINNHLADPVIGQSSTVTIKPDWWATFTVQTLPT